MGVGKSSIGRRLAETLSLPFYDTDQEIAERIGCSVKEIVYYAGEEYFKTTEKKVLEELFRKYPVVISTGGDTFIDKELQKMILQNTITISLNAPVDLIVERISRHNNRPFLDGPDRAEILTKLWQERNDIYQQAHINISCHELSHKEIVNNIIKALQ